MRRLSLPVARRKVLARSEVREETDRHSSRWLKLRWLIGSEPSTVTCANSATRSAASSNWKSSGAQTHGQDNAFRPGLLLPNRSRCFGSRSPRGGTVTALTRPCIDLLDGLDARSDGKLENVDLLLRTENSSRL